MKTSTQKINLAATFILMAAVSLFTFLVIIAVQNNNI